MITSLSRRGKTTLKSNGMFVVPTAQSNLTVALFINTISIHVKRNTLCFVVTVKWSMTVHFVISDEVSGSIWPCEDLGFSPHPRSTGLISGRVRTVQLRLWGGADSPTGFCSPPSSLVVLASFVAAGLQDIWKQIATACKKVLLTKHT